MSERTPPVTMKVVAERVGVSIATVSNAFSRPDQLSAQLRADILLEPAQLDRDRRLSEMQFLCRAGEMAMTRDGFEQSKLLKGEMHRRSCRFVNRID